MRTSLVITILLAAASCSDATGAAGPEPSQKLLTISIVERPARPQQGWSVRAEAHATTRAQLDAEAAHRGEVSAEYEAWLAGFERPAGLPGECEFVPFSDSGPPPYPFEGPEPPAPPELQIGTLTLASAQFDEAKQSGDDDTISFVNADVLVEPMTLTLEESEDFEAATVTVNAPAPPVVTAELQGDMMVVDVASTEPISLGYVVGELFGYGVSCTDVASTTLTLPQNAAPSDEEYPASPRVSLRAWRQASAEIPMGEGESGTVVVRVEDWIRLGDGAGG